MDTTDVRPQHSFNVERLKACLIANNVAGIENSSTLKVRQYNSGQSNPTFYLKADNAEYVMRKKPPGKLLPGAHAVDREFRILKALHCAGYPVAKPIFYCSDKEIIGTEFFIMEHVQGRIFRDASLPALSPAERHAIYSNMAHELAHLHSLDWRKLHLNNFGKTGNYYERQLSTWSKQYKSSVTEPISEMDQLITWLGQHIPPDDTSVIVHGDFRLDNMIFHPTEPKVIAVLDWELSTLGHPLSDLAYNCMPYYIPNVSPQIPGLLDATTVNGKNEKGIVTNKGIPSETEYVSQYCASRSINFPIQDWNYYLAFSFFRIAAILEGVYARSLQGNASAENAKSAGKGARLSASLGWRLASKSFPKNNSPIKSPASVNIYGYSEKCQQYRQQILNFMDKNIYPAEKQFFDYLASRKEDRWCVIPLMQELKVKAKAEGLWNLFLPSISGLTQLEYAPLAEIMGRSIIAPEVFNCGAPDTGNMETLHLFGTEEQKREWLNPLLSGEIRSVFCMTEPAVASSDATNIQCSIRRIGNEYEINGRKWWSSGAGDPRCKVAIVMGIVVKEHNENNLLASASSSQNAGKHGLHSMIIVPTDTPGYKKIRPLTVFGYDDAPHGHFEVEFDHVRVPIGNILLGEGRGFEIAQGRLGPGRIHHCMRLIGLAERALEAMCDRVMYRKTFGKPLAMHGTIQQDIAESRCDIDTARLLTLKAAHMIDTVGARAAKNEIAMIKVVAPNAALRVIDRAIQAHGGAGVCQDFFLANAWASARTLRIADGPDEVHRVTIARTELYRQAKKKPSPPSSL